jgi:lipase chaperone LimK
VAALQPDPTRTQRSVAQVRQALFEQGSLRGVQPDGGFRLDAQGRLMPDRAVRRRFDQLLTTLGEASIEELGALLQQQARTELGSEDGAAQVMAVWERYLQLQRQLAPAGGTGSPPTADSLALALQERARQRRLVLGNDWAEAFYGDEEAALQARLSGDGGRCVRTGGDQAQHTALPAAARAPQPGEDLAALQRQREATLGPEAPARLQALDQAQAAWAQKVAEARSQVTRLRVRPNSRPCSVSRPSTN